MTLCDQKIFISIYDPELDKVIQYSSENDFTLKHVYETVKRIKKDTNYIDKYDYYTNKDYAMFNSTDFRTLRYKNKGNGNARIAPQSTTYSNQDKEDLIGDDEEEAAEED